jgi:hypothetical protein
MILTPLLALSFRLSRISLLCISVAVYLPEFLSCGCSVKFPVFSINYGKEGGYFMAALLSSLGEVVTAVLGYVGNICTTITAQPILLLTMGILLIGGAIGIFGRLLSRG